MKILGKPRTKEILAIVSLLGALAAFTFRMDVQVEQGKLKTVTLLVGQLAKAQQECK